MSGIDILILAAVAAAVFFAVLSIRRRKGGCHGCGGCTGNCSGCAYRDGGKKDEPK